MSLLRLFISSTSPDLQAHREVVHAAIQKMEGHADDMIYWSADERAPVEASVARARNADLVILILAHRYGTIPVGESKSIVHLEYEAAVANQIPVLPFMVDPAHPWPPVHIDRDHALQEKLEQFKDTVASQHVRELFTDPRSLAMLVTQAIHNWEKRNQTQASQHQRIRRLSITVLPRTYIRELPDLFVPFGETPERLPLVGRISRQREIDSAFASLASSVGKTSADAPFDVWRNYMRVETQTIWCAERVIVRNGRAFYVAQLPVQNIGNTLLVRILEQRLSAGSASAGSSGEFTRLINTQPPSGEFTRFFQNTGTRIYGAPPPRRPSVAEHVRDRTLISRPSVPSQSILLALDSDEVHLTRTAIDSTSSRPFYFESLAGLPECKLIIFNRTTGESYRAPLSIAEFPSVLQQTVEDLDDKQEPGHWLWRCNIARQSVAELIVSIARRLGDLHDADEVHGDVKPQNILITNQGPIVIDSLSLKPGQLAFGLTPNWSAPEQVMRMRVSKASDVYPLGLLLCMVLNVNIGGEFVTYRLPDGFEAKVLKNPSLRGWHTDLNESQEAWFEFAERCLSLDPAIRPRDAKEFASEVNTLLRQYPLPGDISFYGGQFASLIAARMDPSGDIRLCRVVDI